MSKITAPVGSSRLYFPCFIWVSIPRTMMSLSLDAVLRRYSTFFSLNFFFPAKSAALAFTPTEDAGENRSCLCVLCRSMVYRDRNSSALLEASGSNNKQAHCGFAQEKQHFQHLQFYVIYIRQDLKRYWHENILDSLNSIDHPGAVARLYFLSSLDDANSQSNKSVDCQIDTKGTTIWQHIRPVHWPRFREPHLRIFFSVHSVFRRKAWSSLSLMIFRLSLVSFRKYLLAYNLGGGKARVSSGRYFFRSPE